MLAPEEPHQVPLTSLSPHRAPIVWVDQQRSATHSSVTTTLCRMKSGSFLSTGWFTMILAMELCEQIYVFGMVSDSYCRCVS